MTRPSAATPNPGAPGPEPPCKRIVRWTFLVLVVTFPLQLLYIALLPEPYPAAIFPRFAHVLEHEGTVKTIVPDVQALLSDGTVVNIQHFAIFDESRVAPGAMLQRLFPFREAPSGDRRQGLLGTARHWLGPDSPMRLHDVPANRATSPATVAWLRDRLQDKLGATPTDLVVTWRELRIDTATLAVRDSRIIRTYELNLASGGTP